MLRRLGRLKISLAAKCQLLFGSAVVLIIAAALFVPWVWMKALTEQINERSADTLARDALFHHVRQHADPRYKAMGPSAPFQSVPQPLLLDQVPHAPAVLIPAGAIEYPDKLTPFQRAALRRFTSGDRRPFYYRYYDQPDGTYGYHFARPVYATGQTCLTCHSPGSVSQLAVGDLAIPAATQPAITQADGAPGTDTTALLGIVAVDMPSQVPPSQFLLNRIILLVAGLIAGSLALIGFYLITTRIILHPIRVLQETAEKVSEGDLNIRSDISTGDEFQQLSETLNTMLANLKEGQDQLRSMNQSLDLKLNQLAESNLALYESNRLKSEFLANVSHELRTPLNSILGFADLLKEAPVVTGDARTARYIQNIIGSGKNLLDLINDLLDLAKIEAGRMEVRSVPISLGDLFEGLTNILRPLAEKGRLVLNPIVEPDVPIIYTDAAKLQQVLYNFMSNAIKFSPAGQKIDLIAERTDDDRLRISVTDRGPGIAADKQKVIFEKFRQIDASVTREHSGTGLGLAISKELTHLLSGQIGVTSNPGEGATFWVILPLKIQASTQDVRRNFAMM